MEIWDILNEYGNITGRTILRGQDLKSGEYTAAYREVNEELGIKD